jgi:hypothetical protein
MPTKTPRTRKPRHNQQHLERLLAGLPSPGANLIGVDLRRANLSGRNLLDANLTEADLTGANLNNANLQLANLSRALLDIAQLRYANLAQANLAQAHIVGADLYGADLRNANLYGANLRDSDLRNADLRNADLRETDLDETNFEGARLEGAKFGGGTGAWAVSAYPAGENAERFAQYDFVPESASKKRPDFVVAHGIIDAADRSEHFYEYTLQPKLFRWAQSAAAATLKGDAPKPISPSVWRTVVRLWAGKHGVALTPRQVASAGEMLRARFEPEAQGYVPHLVDELLYP